MTIRNRLRRLELQPQHRGWDDRPPVLIGLVGKTHDDVIGLHTGIGAETIGRAPGEDFDAFVSRARPALSTGSCGMPLVMLCSYAEEGGEQ